ncbi:ABC transporter permease [Dyadobacter sp. LHD-138]|uniref:ABC transporter permease n=1 Tax=Dyadobacter sp. LHD-138 TaxID=3071413 RepID=UPI0027DF5CD6|nr:FtsX-like permease family protein [Dyadobacter sp. LHD-138]MDQ6482493.1 FtsX-like permease family protein [Dyadobacter sp. LHD-138]
MMNPSEKNGPKPPRWADWLLGRLCTPDMLETIQGDLLEEFHYRLKLYGLRKARWRYGLEVLGFIKPQFIRKSSSEFSSHPYFSFDMLNNYFKIAFRNLRNSKVYSAINIFGLALGLATGLMIILYMADEWRVDKHHADSDRLFRVCLATPTEKWSALAGPVASGLKQDFPEVAVSARILKFSGFEEVLLKYGEGSSRKEFFEQNAYYADSTLFEVFNYDFKFGSANRALNLPNTVVLSEKVAEKMFGNENPVGKVVKIGLAFGTFDYNVTGVFRDNNKSHINAHLLLSMQNTDIGGWVTEQRNWAVNNLFHTYIKLLPGADVKSFEAKLPEFLSRRGGNDLKAMGISKSLFLQPVTDIYLKSNIGNELSPNGSITYLYIFGSIGIFILLIACINFMNLSTARSEKRAREVGIRKAMGAYRESLILQFLGESMIMSLLALLMALGLTVILLPSLNNLIGKQLQLFNDPLLLIWMSVVTLLTGLFAGLYPAFYLSSFRPVSVLKGKVLRSLAAIALRKGLVVFQFTISIILILGAVVAWQQLSFIQNQNLGFDKGQKLIIPLKSAKTSANYSVLKNELLRDPRVVSVSAGSVHPGVETMEDLLFYKENQTVQQAIDIHFATVETEYIETLGFSMVAGRPFSKEFGGDSSSIILNEAAVKKLGFDAATAIGKRLYYEFGNARREAQIIGVVKDFNFESLHTAIRPYALTTFITQKHQYLIADVRQGDYPKLISDFEKLWKKIGSDTPFTYSFLDQDFQRRYEKDQRTANIIAYFTFIAIVIACLGLFGLATFSAAQRTREIGVRKVLGASVAEIAGMLSKEFLVLILLAILIASPIAWFGMHRWLQDFAYKTEIKWWIFALSGLLTTVLAILTVSWQSIKAALMDPVISLRSD